MFFLVLVVCVNTHVCSTKDLLISADVFCSTNMFPSSLNTYCAALNQLVAVNGIIQQHRTSKSLLDGKPFIQN
jgi:hypothetical protein